MKIDCVSGSFNWDTSEYGTEEQDISDFLGLNNATRREYSIHLDLRALGVDGSFDRLYIAMKERLDEVNYGAFKRITVEKSEIEVTAEPIIILAVPPTSEAIQITMEMKTALSEDATIYFCVARTHLE